MAHVSPLDEYIYRAPARTAIRLTQLRARAAAAAAIVRPWLRELQRWILAIAGVLLYLLISAWMQNAELRVVAADRQALAGRVQDLELELAEAAATRGEPLFYVLEAHTPHEARDKLARLGLPRGQAPLRARRTHAPAVLP
jgi:hypothetical protein